MEGYTLFSLSHLGDMTNFIMVLIPSSPLLVALFFPVSLKKLFRQPVYRFLIISMIFSGFAVFLLDPNLGMPRDWDFCAFAGIQLAVFLFYFLFDKRRSEKGLIAVSILAISLNLIVLAPRVISQSLPEVIIPHFETYLQQNHQIDREGRTYLVEYYQRTGDYVSESEQRKIWGESNLEGQQVTIGLAFYERQNYYEAMKAFKNAIKYNPCHSPAYNNMGRCFFKTQQFDSALYYLEIAEAINPYNAPILTNLGMAYLFVKDYKKAEKTWLKAIKIADTLLTPRIYLMQLYEFLGERDEFNRHLLRAGRNKDAPAEIIRKLADYYREQHELDQALIFYRKALDKGLDSSYIVDLQKKYPSLKVF